MIFGFGRNDEDEYDDDEEFELVLFQGTVSGVEVDISEHARLAEAGLNRAKELVTDAIERRAELIRIEPKGERTVAQFQVDGIAFAGGRMSKKEGLAVTQVLKLLSGMDIKQRKKPQHGGLKAEFEEQKYVLDIHTKPLGSGAERLTINIVDVKNAKYGPDELDFNPEIREKIRELSASKTGLMIAAGPPGSGTTTTAFALVRGIDSYIFATYCFIDVGHRELKNISTFDRREDESLDDALRRLIRMEGDVAFVDPISNEEILQTILNKQSELSIITEITAKDAAFAVEKLCKLSGDPKKIAEAVRGVFGQKLIRRLCEKCKKPYRPNPKLLKKVGLDESVATLYKNYKFDEEEDARPCKVCGGGGYIGRIAMLELVEMTEGMKAVVAKGASAADIKVQARKEKMLTFKDDGLRLVAEGMTSLEELQRAFRA